MRGGQSRVIYLMTDTVVRIPAKMRAAALPGRRLGIDRAG